MADEQITLSAEDMADLDQLAAEAATPERVIPGKPAVLDERGQEIEPAVPEKVIPAVTVTRAEILAREKDRILGGLRDDRLNNRWHQLTLAQKEIALTAGEAA